MRFITATVTRDTNHSTTNDYAPWELPILEHLYDSGNVEVTGEKIVADRELPEASDEFARLEARYGKNSETGVPHIEEVYGRGNQGIKALAELIDKERAVPKKRASNKAGADELAA